MLFPMLFAVSITTGSWRLASIAVAFLLALAAAPALALDPARLPSQYMFKSWGQADGLPAATVWTLLQTRDGYLWLGTQGGLVRFDGVRFTAFLPEAIPALGTGNVRALWEDDQGTLWIGVFGGGLVRYQDGRFEALGAEADLPSKLVRALAPAPEGGVWVGAQAGGVALVREGKVVERLSTKNGLPGDDVRCLRVSRSGDLWIGLENGGLVRWRAGGLTTWKSADGLLGTTVMAILEDRAGTLWIATTYGLNRFEGERLVGYGIAEGLSSDYLFSLGEDRDGNLWIGTGVGLDRHFGARFATLTSADGLADNHVWSTLEDREGNLWVATEKGLSRLRAGTFFTWGARQGLSADWVRGLREDQEGGMWLGTEAGLDHLRDGKVTTWTQRDGLPGTGVWSVLETRAGELWSTGDLEGLARRHDGRFTSVPPAQGIASWVCWSLLEDRAGAIWVGCQIDGLARYAEGRWTIFGRPEGLGAEAVRVLLEDRQGDLWAGTQGGGLARLRDGTITNYTTRDGLGADYVMALYEDGEGRLWVGTYGGGLGLRVGERFRFAARKDGLFTNSVGGIVEDELGHLWLVGDRGLFRASRAELVELIEGRRNSVASEHFDATDGLAGALGAAFTPNVWRARDGRLWFASRAGAAVVDPRRIARNTVPPPLAIERLLADHQEVDLRAPATLAPGTFDLEIHYTALSFSVPERIRFRYRLAGFDADWVEAGDRRTAYYTNLPPGEHRFEVLAANEDGVWSPEPATLHFRLLPRYYQTAWFKGALAVLALLTVYGLYRLRVGHLEARAAVAEERNRLAREIHDTIAQDLAAIRMQTQAAQRESESKPEGVTARLERIGSAAERALEETRRALRALRPRALEGRDLVSALEETVRVLDPGPDTRIEVRARGAERTLRPRVEAELLRIAGEAVANAIKYAQASSIAIDLEIRRRLAILSVHDDGRGFDLETLSRGAHGGGLGLIGMRERAERLGGRLEIRTAPGAGTRVEVRVPLAWGWR